MYKADTGVDLLHLVTKYNRNCETFIAINKSHIRVTRLNSAKILILDSVNSGTFSKTAKFYCSKTKIKNIHYKPSPTLLTIKANN